MVPVTFPGCSMFKPKFDPDGYQYASTLKEAALELMKQADKPYDDRAADVYLLMTKIERAYEHSLTRYKNDNVIATWDRLRDPNRNRLGGFMEQWRKEDKLDNDTITTYTQWVSDEFDMLVSLETGKNDTPEDLKGGGDDK